MTHVHQRTVTTGARTQIPIAAMRWSGESKRLDTGELHAFSHFLRLAPRGPRVLVDPFVPAASVTISGTVFSPARALDPSATVQAWVDGQATTVGTDGRFTATVALHPDKDQVTFRAVDATKLEGRGYVETLLPASGAPIARPARYGRTRAEVQRFVLVNAAPDTTSVDLVLKKGDGSELGRVTAQVQTADGETATEWVCITATDPRQSAPALAPVEGKVFRAPDVHATLELQIDGHAVGEPVRFSGWDPSTWPAAVATSSPGAAPSKPLGGKIGGEFSGAPRLTFLVDSDADGVLLPGTRGATPTASVGRSVGSKESELAAVDPVELTDEVELPHGWASLEVAGHDDDGWDHADSFQILTYEEVPESTPEVLRDFVYTARRDRVQWPDGEGAAVHPDQLNVHMKDGSSADDVATICRKHGLEVVGAIGRSRFYVLESPEPLARDELDQLVQTIGGESGVDSAGANFIVHPRATSVGSVRTPDYLRSAASGRTNPDEHLAMPGVFLLDDANVLGAHLQMRTFPAQALIARLEADGHGALPSVTVAVCDSGFGPGTSAAVSPDFSAGRFPSTAAHQPGGMLVTSTGDAGSLSTLVPLTHPDMVDRADRGGHGTLSIHALAGFGTAAHDGRPTSPRAGRAPALDRVTNSTLRSVPWCVGTGCFLSLFPIGYAPGGHEASNARVALALRAAVARPEVRIVNMSFGSGNGDVVAPADLAGVRADFAAATGPFEAAKRNGTILVVSLGEIDAFRGQSVHQTTQSYFDFLVPAGPRSHDSFPLVGVSATKVEANSDAQHASDYSKETQTDWTYYGPQVTVAAPGENLMLRTITGGTGAGEDTAGELTRGTSFSAPFVSGLFGLMMLADKLAGRSRTGMDFANKLIDLVAYTARKSAALMGAAGTLKTDYVGHGSIDCWAAVLSILNDGPLILSGQNKHADLVNTGASVSASAVVWYGFEILVSAVHAKPVLVNVTTGAWSPLVDALALDPACDTHGSRPIWSWQSRTPQNDGVLPVRTFAQDTDAWFSIQFSIKRAQLSDFTHLVFQRAPDQPTVVATAGSHDLDTARTPSPARTFYGLPLAPLLAHDVSGHDIAPWHVSLQHFIFKAKTNEHGRHLRVTFDQVEVLQGPDGDYTCSATVNTNAVSAMASVHHHSGTHKTIYLEASTTPFFASATDPITISFTLNGPSGTSAYARVAYRPPKFSGDRDPHGTQPLGPNTPWGFGDRVLVDGSNKMRVHFRVEQEPNLPRFWRVNVDSVNVARPGNYRVKVAVNGLRFGGHVAATAAGPSSLAGLFALAPYTSDAPPVVEIRVSDEATGQSTAQTWSPPAGNYASSARQSSSLTVGNLAVAFTLATETVTPSFEH
jgi:hypothetical protein